jgi:hypothetical protein
MTWGAPIWPPTPPHARQRPGEPGARLGLARRFRGGPDIAPHTPHARQRPGEPGARLGLARRFRGGPDMARLIEKGASKGPLYPRALDGPGATPGPSRYPGALIVLRHSDGLGA